MTAAGEDREGDALPTGKGGSRTRVGGRRWLCCPSFAEGSRRGDRRRPARHERGKMLMCIIWGVKWLIRLRCNILCF